MAWKRKKKLLLLDVPMRGFRKESRPPDEALSQAEVVSPIEPASKPTVAVSVGNSSLLAGVAGTNLVAIDDCIQQFGGRVFALVRRVGEPAEAHARVRQVFRDLWQKASQYQSSFGPESCFVVALARHHLLRDKDDPLDTRPLRLVASQAQARDVGALVDVLRPSQLQVLGPALLEGVSLQELAEKLAIPLGEAVDEARAGLARVAGGFGVELTNKEARSQDGDRQNLVDNLLVQHAVWGLDDEQREQLMLLMSGSPDDRLESVASWEGAANLLTTGLLEQVRQSLPPELAREVRGDALTRCVESGRLELRELAAHLRGGASTSPAQPSAATVMPSMAVDTFANAAVPVGVAAEAADSPRPGVGARLVVPLLALAVVAAGLGYFWRSAQDPELRRRAMIHARAYTGERHELSAPNEPGRLGDVVWSQDQQVGFLCLDGVPPNKPAEKQYQLWILDRKRGLPPVDGGVFDVGAEGRVVVPIRAKLRVKEVAGFRVTLEEAGGEVQSLNEQVVARSRR